MCKPASFVLTKNKIFWSEKTESHEEIISEHKLHADGARGANIVRVEITPPGEDYRLPLDQWVYGLDQYELPKWYDAKKVEARVREELPAWLSSKVVLPGEEKEVCNGVIVACYGQVTAYDSSQVRAYDSSQVTACDSSQVRAYGSSQVRAYDSSQVRAYDSSQVTAYGSSQVRAYGSSQVREMSGYSVVQTDHHIDPEMTDEAVLIDRSGNKPKIFVCGKEYVIRE